MLGLSLLVGIGEVLVMVVLRRRRSGWGLAGVSRSWEGSQGIEMEGVHCMRRMWDGLRMGAVLPVSLKLRGGIRSHDGP